MATPMATSTIRGKAIEMDKFCDANPFNKITCIVIKITAKYS